MIDQLKSRTWILLSSKSFSITCIVVSIISRIMNVLHVSHTSGDKVKAAVISRSFLEGNGLCIPEYFVANPETPFYNNSPFWPPGYTLFLSLFLKIFNYDLFWSFTAIDLIAGVCMVFIVREFCKLIEFNKQATNFATLLAGCFSYSFINASCPTDFITVTLVFLAYFLVIKTIKNENINYQQLYFTSFILVLPCFFRYSYHLAIAFVPFTTILIGYLKKNQLILRKGRILLISATIIYTLLGVVQYFLNDSLYFVLQTEKGFYPENLLHWSPFIPESFFSPNFIYVKFIAWLTDIGTFFSFLEIINLFIFLCLFSAFIYYLKRIQLSGSFTVSRWFLFIGTVMSVGVLLLLALVTVLNKEQSFHASPWNYINESRYFAFLFLFTQMVFIGWALAGKGFPAKNVFLKSIRFVLLIFLTLEIIHNLYFNYTLPFRYKELKEAHYWQKRGLFVEQTVLEVIKNNRDHEVLTGDYYYQTASHVAAYYGGKALQRSSDLNKSLPKVKRNTILLLFLTDDEIPFFKDFFSMTNVPLYKKYEYGNFYLMKLSP